MDYTCFHSFAYACPPLLSNEDAPLAPSGRQYLMRLPPPQKAEGIANPPRSYPWRRDHIAGLTDCDSQEPSVTSFSVGRQWTGDGIWAFSERGCHTRAAERAV